MIVDCDPDFAIVATGASDRVLDGVEGLDQPNVRSAYDVLAGSADLATGAVVIYGAGEIGCEAAKFAAQRGCDVVLATRSCDEMAISRANKLRMLSRTICRETEVGAQYPHRIGLHLAGSLVRQRRVSARRA